MDNANDHQANTVDLSKTEDSTKTPSPPKASSDVKAASPGERSAGRAWSEAAEHPALDAR